MSLRADILGQCAGLADAATLVVDGTSAASATWLIAQAAQHRDMPWHVVIVPDADQIARTVQDLQFFAPQLTPHALPPRPGPYQTLPASVLERTQRLATLAALARPAARGVLVTSLAALQQWQMPFSDAAEWYFTIAPGATMDRDSVAHALVARGYVDMSLVEDRGTFAVRGALIDVWPPHLPWPIRLEWDGDTLHNIRSFHPETQRTQQQEESVTIGAAEECLWNDADRATLIRSLRELADAADLPTPQRAPYLQALEHRTFPAWLETFVPLAPARDTLAAYLPLRCRCWWLDSVTLAQQALQRVADLPAQRDAAEPMLQLLAPDAAHVQLTDIAAAAGHIICGNQSLPWLAPTDERVELPTIAESTWTAEWRARGTDTAGAAFDTIGALLRDGQQVQIICHTQMAAQRTHDLLRWHGLRSVPAGDVAATRDTVQIRLGNLSAGFGVPGDGLALITETAIFGRKTRVAKTRPTGTPGEAFAGFQDLAPGDCIVHEQHGVGRFLGMSHMDVPTSPLTPVTLGVMGSGKQSTMQADFVQLEYLGGDKLYLPVYRLHLLQRYVGPAEGAPILDKLGHKRWGQVKQKAVATIRAMAHELLKMYAERASRSGFAFSGRDQAMETFESTFPYDETPDQWQAIEDVLRDMQSPKPMDRLICGDVGFGKTEVALRAAFRAAADGKQVALLCPTTLLAYQHGQNFAARFAHTGLRVEHISRFRSKAEQAELIKDLAAGKIDVMIGTHRLFSQDVKFPRLGLLIIDEEQRFGVAHKEKIRKLRATVDTLTLSATPIPRTLHSSLAGLRDVSIIQTPPVDRQAIRTHILPFSDTTVREAMQRELARGGEIFFVHNRVQTISSMRDRILRIVPDAKIVIAHGQLDEAALEDAMHQFIDRKANVLLCTSIIEAGLDIPSANTLIVNRADTFGLAQLYQIRGRVGRGNQQAFAYLLTPAVDALELDGVRVSALAQRRLATLARYSALGSGFSIAMQDLELRGAGNLLGAQQSGHLQDIGYDMFHRLLERTIRSLKGETVADEIDPEITLPVPALLPADYITDDNQRLIWYKRLSSCTSDSMLEHAEEELADRFGPLPEPAVSLLAVIQLRIQALHLRITSVQYTAGVWRFAFNHDTPVEPATLFRLVNKFPKRYQIKPDGAVIVRDVCETPNALFTAARTIMKELHAKA